MTAVLEQVRNAVRWAKGGSAEAGLDLDQNFSDVTEYGCDQMRARFANIFDGDDWEEIDSGVNQGEFR